MHKLKDLCHIERGATGIMKAVPGKYPMVGIAEERRTHTSYQFDAAAVIIPLVSSTGHGHASLKRIHYQEGKFALGSILSALIPKDPAQLDPLYLYHYLDVYKEKLFVPLMKGMANVSLSLTSIGEVEVPVPTKAEQDEWVQKFEWVNEQQEALTTELDLQHALLKQLRQAILQDAVQGKLTTAWRAKHHALVSGANHARALRERVRADADALVLAGKMRKPKSLPPVNPEEMPFELPTGWVWCRLGELADIVRGGSPRPAGDPRFYHGDIPFLRVGDLTNGEGIYLHEHSYTIKEAGLEKTRFVDAETVMLTNSGATLGVPRICGFRTTLNDGIAAFTMMPAYLSKEYMYWFLKSKTSWFQKSAARGQGQTNLNITIIGEMLYPLPPEAEQKAITEHVQSYMNMIATLDADATSTVQISRSLLQSVLSEVMGGGAKYGEVEGGLSLAAEPQAPYGRKRK